MANEYKTVTCPVCGAHFFQRKGLTKNGEKINLLCTNCGKRFSVDYNAEANLPASEVKSSTKSKTAETATTVKAAKVKINDVKVAESTTSTKAASTFTLYAENGTEILPNNEKFTSKQSIINFCSKMSLVCEAVDEAAGIYKATTKRVHSKGC